MNQRLIILSISQLWERKHLLTLKFERWGRLFTQFFQYWASFSGILSSQVSFSLQSCCKRILARRTTGARNPSGSYMELTNDRTPLLVTGLWLTLTRNLKQSDSMHQSTPSALSTGIASVDRSKSLTSFALSFSGIAAKIARLLLVHFVKWKPPAAHRVLRSLLREIASESLLTYFKQSST